MPTALKSRGHCAGGRETEPERLGDACRAWAEQHEPRELRKVLLAIMGLLDG